MKKNYTLKITLAMLFVVLVSLVSFVGVYKGKNLVKDYSLGKDFKERKVAVFSVKEQTNSENTTDKNTQSETENNDESTKEENSTEENKTEETNTEENKTEEKSEEDKKKDYENSKNIIERRLASLKSDEYDIRLNEENGSLVIEVPTSMDSSYITELVSKGKAQIKNQSTNEVLVDSNGFKDASAKIDSTNYPTPMILLNIEFTKDAKNIFKNANTNYTDSEGNEKEATFAFTLDDETLYSDTAVNFVSSAKNGALDLVLGQGTEGEKLQKNYESAQVLVSIIKTGSIPVEYQSDSITIVSSNINIKTIVIIAIIIGALMLIYAIIKLKNKAILPVLSLVGLVASILLVLRYTNVEITLFGILGLATIVVSNYVLILRTLQNDKTFKENFVDLLNILIPVIIIAIVFCCAPYLQLATLGMTIFWGIIVMFIYNIIITKVLIDK
ncbi:protein translocase subunit SecD [Clostridium sp. CAG:492]|nr:protein translocase subunit SecD [Clostridium sp. CAG:492]